MINTFLINASSIARAAELIRMGELVCFPTETVYGLGANALDPVAVSKVFKTKGRPSNNPLIVHIAAVDDLQRISRYQDFPVIRQRVAALSKFWPGALSLLLPKQACVPDAVTAGSDLVAVRIPAHAGALALLHACNLPIAAPSANKFTEVSPTTAQHCQESFSDGVAMILDGGPCTGGIESTVLNLSSDTVTIMRPGLITREQLEQALGEPVIFHSQQLDAEQLRISPGLHHKHYAPKTTLRFLKDFVTPTSSKKLGVILFSENRIYSACFA